MDLVIKEDFERIIDMDAGLFVRTTNVSLKVYLITISQSQEFSPSIMEHVMMEHLIRGNLMEKEPIMLMVMMQRGTVIGHMVRWMEQAPISLIIMIHSS